MLLFSFSIIGVGENGLRYYIFEKGATMGGKANKVLVLGIDGLDPKLVQRYIDEGIMPNTEAFLKRGAANNELKMIGGHPTVTPPMWTTLATGASPYVHGVYDFFKKGDSVGEACYNFDSRNSSAEPLWNVTAEAGWKTMVWHWPGSSWPPTSENPLLTVVDGTQPEGVNCGVANCDPEHLIVASEETPALLFRAKAASDSNVPCYIEDMDVDAGPGDSMLDMVSVSTGAIVGVFTEDYDVPPLSDTPLDLVLSPIQEASGWNIAVEPGTKELIILHSHGLIRRPALILKDENGICDRIAIYKSKKDNDPLCVLRKGIFESDIIDDAIKDDEYVSTNRNMRILELAEDGSSLRIWISSAMDYHNDLLWSSKELLPEIVEKVGYPQPVSVSGCGDERLISDCMRANWDHAAKWNADALKYFAREKGYQVIFSHFHNVDLQGHMLVAFLKKGSKLPPETVQRLFRDVYIQTDEYIGQILPLLDEGWTIIVVSDHGQTCPEYSPNTICITPMMDGVTLKNLGYTVLKKDENGRELPEIDWSKTQAVNWRMGEIWINLKGRDWHGDVEGIVDPADKYELEERIMTDLYELKHPETGHRAVLLAMRNKDAVVLGMGGPNCGDIVFFDAEGYTVDHADSISTVEGACGTSVMSYFMAAGPGIKEDYLTPRIVKHVDVAPTVATLLGVRMPAECEGAPVYQILE